MTGKRKRPVGPLARAVEGAVAFLDGRLYQPHPEAAKVPPLDVRLLELRLRTALLRDQAGSTIPDGFPRGGSGGGSTSDVKLTSVEAAAEARTDGRREADPVHAIVRTAVTQVLQAQSCLQIAVAALDELDRIESEAPVDSPACESCTDCGSTAPRAWENYGTVGGRLDKQRHLCRPCREFVEDTGREPTTEEHRRHNETGRWRPRKAS